MAGVEVASAYVTLMPSLKGFGKQVEKDMPGLGDKSSKEFQRGFGGRMKSVAKGVFAPLAAAAAGIGVKDFLAGAIDEARESQKVGALTAQTIKATGGAAKVSAAQIGDLATAISNKTGMDDEAIQSGANMLLTFKNIKNEAGKGNDIFNQTTSILTDMSSVMGTEPKQAAIQLGKALNDPVKGISALSRVGVTFTAKQKATIKSLVDTGKTADAQKIILKELNSEFGGAAAAQATAGEKMSTAWGNLKEQIGTALLPVIDKVESFMTEKAIPAVSQFLTEMQNGTGKGGAFVDKLKLIADKAKELGTWIKTNVIPPIKELIQQFKDGEGSGGKFRTILEKIGKAVTAAFGWLQKHPGVVKTFVAGFAGLYGAKKALDGAAAGMGKITSTVTGVKEKFDKVKDGIQSVKDAGNSAKEAYTSVKDGITKIGGAAKSGAKWVKDLGAGQKIASAATKVWTGVQAAFNLVMSANPIVLLALAIAALVVGVIIAYEKVGWFRAAVDTAFGAVKSAASAVLNFFKNNWKLILGFLTGPIGLAVVAITTHWSQIKGLFNKAWTWVTTTFRGLWNGFKSLLSAPINGAKTAISTAITGIKNGFRAAWTWATSTFRGLWNGFKSLLTTPVNLAKTAVRREIDGLKNIFRAVWTWASGTFRAAWNGFKSLLSKPVSLAKSAISREIDGVKRIFSSAKTAIGKVWSGLTDKIKSPIKSVVNWIGNNFVGKLNSVLSKVGLGKNFIPWVKLATGGILPGGGHQAPLAYASGGVLPGYSPGRDNMHFTGPSGGLSLAGGEAIMRPEWTRAVGPGMVNAMNAAARSGGKRGVQRLLGGGQAFAGGGIIGDVWEKVKTGAGKAWDFGKLAASVVTDPAGALKKLGSKLLGGITSNLWGKIGKGALTKGVGGLVNKVKDALSGGGGMTGLGSMALGGSGSGAPGSGWRWMWNLIHSKFPNVQMTSNYRPGAVTAGSGQVSMHARGRAIDLGGSVPELTKVAKWIAANYGSKSADLLYSPLWGNMGIYRGHWYPQPAVTVAQHGNHVHWGYDEGGIVPNLYDNGGYLPPGLSMVANKTGKPEPILTQQQWGDLRDGKGDGGSTSITINSVDTDVAGDVAEEMLWALRRSGRGRRY